MAHPEQMDFCKQIKARFPEDFTGKCVLDVGSLDINGNNRGLFGDCDYTGIDLGPGNNVDVICSAHEHKGLYDTIISTEAFEHDPSIKASLNNIAENLLAPGGLFLFTCAGEGRHEHGTDGNMPEDSPFTNDYYQNLSEDKVRGLVDIESWFGTDYKFSRNLKTNDLYFVGRKQAEGGSCEVFWEPSKVSIIIPVIRRESAQRCISAIRENAGVDFDQYEIITAFDDNGIGCPQMVRMLVNQSSFDLVCFLGDDTEPEHGFLAAALVQMALLPDGWGVVGLNTEGGNDCAHWIADKRMLGHIPGGNFFSTDYEHCYGDGELKDIAMELDRWGFAEGARIKHHHPINGTANFDEGYQTAYESGRFERDKATFQRRKNERMRAHGVRHLGIAWPLTNLMLFSDFALSWEMLEKPGPYSFFYPQIANQMDTANPGGSHNANLDVIRNELVDQALMHGVTDLLFADTDQIYMTRDMIPRMLAHDAPLVVARVHRRYPPFDPIMLMDNPDGVGYHAMDFNVSMDAIESGATVELDASGFGCVMIKTEVLCAMGAPWFNFDKRETGETVGEDVYFYEKARAAGFKLLMDTSIDIRHAMTKGVGAQDFMLWEKLNRSGGVKKNGRGK